MIKLDKQRSKVWIRKEVRGHICKARRGRQ